VIRLLIVDDHMIFREGVKKVLATASDIAVTGETGDGREALQMISENPYEVILLDLALPGTPGLDVLRSVRARDRGPAVLVLSIYPEEQYATRVLKEGALGYLTKESIPSELIRAIRKAAQGRRYVSDSLAERLAGDLAGGSGRQPHEALSPREYQVFEMLASGKSIKEIAFALSSARTTISSYRARILDKMNMKTNADLIRYATEHQLL
jgi:two-component system, NarL family, invasion response regulator UvrY